MMAKKRTIVPFYGKKNQAMEEAALRIAARGAPEAVKMAKTLIEDSEADRKKRMSRHV